MTRQRRLPTLVWIVCAFIAGAWLSPDLPIDVRGAPAATATPVTAAPSGPAWRAVTGRPSATPGVTAAAGGTPAAEPSPAVPAEASPTGRPGPPPPDCTYRDEPATPDPDGGWTTAIIDTTYRLPAGYRPDDLVPVSQAGLDGGGSVSEVIIDDLRALADAAATAGRPLAVQSAFRSESRQAAVFEGWVASHGERAARRFSARPGHSEHQLGTAVDFRAKAGSAPWDVAFEATKTGRWLADHAAEYGFLMSYPEDADEQTCYGYEPWHFRWVGRAVARDVAASGETLRAWLWARQSGG